MTMSTRTEESRKYLENKDQTANVLVNDEEKILIGREEIKNDKKICT